ncbi:MAG: GNAT family N-acetyltransferase [Pseudomonadota bacterium]
MNLAGPAQANACLGLVAKYHEEAGLPFDDAHRKDVILPLLDGSPLGAIWVMGPIRAPMGYVIVTFEWSLAQGGMVGWVREIYTRPNVRNRGIGTETLHAVAVALRAANVKALQVDLQSPDNPQASFWRRAGFTADSTPYVLKDVL